MSIYERTKEVPASIDIFQRLFLQNQAAGSLVSFLRAGPARSRNGAGAASASFTGVVFFSRFCWLRKQDHTAISFQYSSRLV